MACLEQKCSACSKFKNLDNKKKFCKDMFFQFRFIVSQKWTRQRTSCIKFLFTLKTCKTGLNQESSYETMHQSFHTWKQNFSIHNYIFRCAYYKVHELIIYPFIFQKNPLKQWKNNKRTFTCHNKVVWVWNRKFSECTRIQCYEQKKMIISWMQFGQQEIIWSFGTLLVPLPNLLLQHNGDTAFLKEHLHF